jgi:hypothetical protein
MFEIRFGSAGSGVLTWNPGVAGLYIAALDRRPGDHVRAPFAVRFAGCAA